jgi:hypothetical protein
MVQVLPTDSLVKRLSNPDVICAVVIQVRSMLNTIETGIPWKIESILNLVEQTEKLVFMSHSGLAKSSKEELKIPQLTVKRIMQEGFKQFTYIGFYSGSFSDEDGIWKLTSPSRSFVRIHLSWHSPLACFFSRNVLVNDLPFSRSVSPGNSICEAR